MPGLVHLYFGDGKGKTTASLGLIIRALGAQKKVLLVQFMKLPQTQFEQFGEIRFLKDHITYKQFGSVDWVIKGKVTQKAIDEVRAALEFVRTHCATNEYDLIVADELLYCLDMQICSEEELRALIIQKSPEVELVLTGSHKKWPALIACADYATQMQKHKHPYEKGIIARKGIEF